MLLLIRLANRPIRVEQATDPEKPAAERVAFPHSLYLDPISQMATGEMKCL